MTQTHVLELRSARSGDGRKSRRSLAAILVVLACASGCATSSPSTVGSGYPTPEQGGDALVAALRSHDKAQLEKVLGPIGVELLQSGDEVADRNEAAAFVEAYDQRHKIVKKDSDHATIVVGHKDWPLPIPLVRDGASWHFDVESGSAEITARRIGGNELAAIETCRAIVDAQQDYARLNMGTTRTVYASHFVSDPGQRNGLYWEVQPNEPPSPLGLVVAQAVREGYVRAPEAAREVDVKPYRGYCYRMLAAQGPSAPGGARGYMEGGQMLDGFALAAWPATYEASGVMTFMVCQNGIVYQKDLGTDTARLAPALMTFDPGDGWTVVP